MNILDWAKRWEVSPQALRELATLSQFVPLTPKADDMSESAVQARVRLEAARAHIHAWRNNVGGFIDARGIPVRYGLGNDSKRFNEVCKSADLIGIKPRLIEPADVGHIIGQFWSRECKRSDWKFKDTPEERAQVAWAAIINASGGDAAIVTSTGSV